MQDLLKIKWVNRINNYAIPVVLFRSSNPKGHVMYCHGFTPYVVSFSRLFFFVLCTLCCQFLSIVFLCLMYPMLSVSLDCFSLSYVPYVVSFSRLFFFFLCTQCCQFLWIVFVLCFVYPMLPVSLDCLRLVYPMFPCQCLFLSCVPNVARPVSLFILCP